MAGSRARLLPSGQKLALGDAGGLGGAEGALFSWIGGCAAANPCHEKRGEPDAAGAGLYLDPSAAAPIPMAGFHAAGEIGPVGNSSFLHGQTACVAMFRGA